MSVEDKEVIDFITTDKASGRVILTMTDHLDWNDSDYHLKALLDKLNAYLVFIESGQIFESYPESIGQGIVIQVMAKYPLPSIGESFMSEANRITQKRLSIPFEFELFETIA